MTLPRSLYSQRGSTLIVGLIMLLLFTLMISSAFTMSGSNLKAVGNMQSRDEAIAAANAAIEQVVSLNFTSLTAAQPYELDFDQDPATPPYLVTVTVEGCRRATPAPVDESLLSGVASGIPSTSGYYTLWELKSVVADGLSGAAVTVRHGVRKYMGELDPDFAKCS